MIRPGHRPGNVRPQISLFSRSPAPATLFLGVPAPSDDVGFAPKRRLTTGLASSTEDAVFIGPLAPISTSSALSSTIVLNTWSVYDRTTGPVLPPIPSAASAGLREDDAFRRLLIKKPLPDTINAVGIAAGQFLPQFVAQWSQPSDIFRRILTKKPLPDTVTSAGIPIIPPPPTVASASTEQFVINTWSINFATNIVAAIPVADTWYEVLDVPSWIKGKKFAGASSTYETLNAPPSAVIGTNFASALSGMVVVNTWSIHDRTAGPVLPPPTIPPPPVFLPDATVFARLRVKGFLGETSAPIGIPIPPPSPPPITKPPPGGGWHRGDRGDLGRYWRYGGTKKKKKDLEEELERIEEAIAEEVAPPQPDNLVGLTGQFDRLEVLDERTVVLLADIKATLLEVRAKALQRAYANMEARAIEVRRKIEVQEQEEEQAAWLLLHLLQ